MFSALCSYQCQRLQFPLLVFLPGVSVFLYNHFFFKITSGCNSLYCNPPWLYKRSVAVKCGQVKLWVNLLSDLWFLMGLHSWDIIFTSILWIFLTHRLENVGFRKLNLSNLCCPKLYKNLIVFSSCFGFCLREYFGYSLNFYISSLKIWNGCIFHPTLRFFSNLYHESFVRLLEGKSANVHSSSDCCTIF